MYYLSIMLNNQTHTDMNTTTSNPAIEILDNGSVRVNGEVATYDNLLSVIDPVGEYETEQSGTLVLFEIDGNYIEFLLDGSFHSGEQANLTTLSFDEIMEYYEVK